MISDKTKQLVNYRIAQEQQSSRIYEQMYYWLSNKGFLGAAVVWEKFYKEELEHAKLATEFLLSFGIMPELSLLEEPDNNYKDIGDIINSTYKHEELITKQCIELQKYAIANEPLLLPLALKYIDIQVKEMEEATNLTDVYKLHKDPLVFDEYLKNNF